MKTKTSSARYQLGELIATAYEEAQRVTPDARLAAQLAAATVTRWLSQLGRPDLARQLCGR